MAQKMSKFHKVSYQQFRDSWLETFFEDKEDYTDPVTREVYLSVDNYLRGIYAGIELPKRATAQSAGYDFHMPCTLTLKAGDSIKIPTGICCEMYDGWVLMLYPRSGLGFKYGMGLANTVGIVDGDYFEADNEGHIFAKLTNNSSLAKDITFKAGDAFCQGVFLQFGITLDDEVTDKRHGGFGSTGR